MEIFHKKELGLFSFFIIFLCFIIAMTATIGSLYFSEVLFYHPCKLCWYQRILIYPLTLFILIGLIRKDAGLYLYILPFSFLGIIISIYHYALQMGLFSTSIICTAGSCAIKYVEILGYITIPFLSFISFLLITFLFLLQIKVHNQN